jgi:hypothetical protein
MINKKEHKAFDDAIEIISNYYDIEQIAIYSDESNELTYSSKNVHSNFLEQYVRNQILIIRETIRQEKLFNEEVYITGSEYILEIFPFNNPENTLLIMLYKLESTGQELTYILQSINEMILLLSHCTQKNQQV